MRVLVTGGLGYVGMQVVAALQSQNIAVEICDCGWFTGALSHPLPLPELRDFRMLSAHDFHNIDAVIHLAGFSNDPLGKLHAQQTDELNHRATLSLAGLARKAGVARFVFASTCSVYGACGNTQCDEFAKTAPITPYGLAKREAELGLLALQAHGFDVAILRGATAYGYSPCPRGDLLLNEFAMMAALGRPLVLSSNGESWRPFMPVEMFARALVAAALVPPQTDDGLPIWNIAPPAQQMTVARAARRAARACGAPAPEFGEGLPADGRSYRVDGRRFAQAFPQIAYGDDFDDQIRRTVAAFAECPTLADDLASGRFIRLKMLESYLAAQRGVSGALHAV